MAQVKVKLLTPRGGLNFSHQPGDVIEVDTKTAARMRKAGHCEILRGKAAETAALTDPAGTERAIA